MKQKFLPIVAAVLIAGLSISNPTSSVSLAEETYVVQPGDTLYGICTQFRKKDCTDPYILEYMDTIREVNPQLVQSRNQLQVGDKIKIVYNAQEG